MLIQRDLFLITVTVLLIHSTTRTNQTSSIVIFPQSILQDNEHGSSVDSKGRRGEALCGTNFITVQRETKPPLVRVRSEAPEFERKLQ